MEPQSLSRPSLTRPPTRQVWRSFLGGLALAAGLAGSARADAPVVRAASLRRGPVVEVVERVRAAVVNIQSERLARPDDAHPSSSSNRVNGMGTGVVIDPRGYIVTNHHVIEDVTILRVRLHDGTSLPARVVARDAETDLAMLKVEPLRPMATVALGTASDLMVGESVIAVGNAFGYDHTVTVGVVSATKRDVNLNKEVSYKQLIQTDASINPGNSGGPLLNIYGELVGVNVAIRAGAQGIGFAIPVDTVVKVAADMLRSRRRGVSVAGLGTRDRVEPNAQGPAARSLVVEQVERGSVADKSGLQVGDVVSKAGDVPVCCLLDLERALIDRNPSDSLPVVVHRAGATKTTPVSTDGALVSRGADATAGADVALTVALSGAAAPAAAAAPVGDVVWRRAGLKVVAVGPEAVQRVNPQLRGGLLVTEVNPAGAAGRAGLLAGDVLVGLHLWETLSPDNVVFVLEHRDLATFSPLKFYIIRQNKVRQGNFTSLD